MDNNVIYADDREDGTVLKEFLSTNLNVEVKRLKCGDYVMGDVCVERKTIDDFCGSIMNGRLKVQYERMRKLFSHNYVLVSGKLGDRTSEINENCILGYISGMLVKGINVCIVDNDKQLVYLMKRLFERFIELKGGKTDENKKG